MAEMIWIAIVVLGIFAGIAILIVGIFLGLTLIKKHWPDVWD